MQVQADVLYKRYLNMQLTDKRTIGQMYSAILGDVKKLYDNKSRKELQQMSMPLKRLSRYYEDYVFNSTEAINITPDLYKSVMVMYARLCYLTSSLTYNVLVPKGQLKTILIECSMIEQIFMGIFHDLHNDETLLSRSRQSGYEYYKRPELRSTYNKNLKSDEAIERSILAARITPTEGGGIDLT